MALSSRQRYHLPKEQFLHFQSVSVTEIDQESMKLTQVSRVLKPAPKQEEPGLAGFQEVAWVKVQTEMPTGQMRKSGCETAGSGQEWVQPWPGLKGAATTQLLQECWSWACRGLCFILREASSLGFCMKCPSF